MDSLVNEFLKVKRYERTRKRVKLEKDWENVDLQNFMMFLKKRRNFRQKSKLSFALNLEKDDAKFSIKDTNINLKSKRRTEKGVKDEIPAEFIQKITRLGFQDSDAQVLYESKDDWMGINTG